MYGVGSPCNSLEQAPKCGEVKPVNGIHTPSLELDFQPHYIYLQTINVHYNDMILSDLTW